MQNQDIPLEILDTKAQKTKAYYCRSILENEIGGIHVEHIALSPQKEITDSSKEGFKAVYLFISGTGAVVAENSTYEIVPETIFLPNGQH